MEKWKYIKDINNKYLISDLGNIKSIDYKNSKKEKCLSFYGKNYKMKKFIISIISILAFLYLIGEPEEITIRIVALKFLSLFWLWLIAKANNYFNNKEVK